MWLAKLNKYKKRPFFVLKVLIKSSITELKRLIYILKYKVVNKNVTIGKAVRFNQRTIFTGCGSSIVKKNVSFGYKYGGHYYKNLTEIQARFHASQIVINENVSFNNANYILAGNYIEIGSNCKIGARVTMMDFEAHGTLPNERENIGKLGEIHIGNNVWIGNDVIILKNVNVGDNSIIAAGSVVKTGNYPSDCIIGGNPAKVIKNILT